MSRRSIVIFALLATLVFATLYPLVIMRNGSKGVFPLRLAVGDSWTYKVAFPDSTSYKLTESIEEIDDLNGTEAYVLLKDDPQHLSTQYLWITLDWHEIKTFTPSIGNLLAISTVTYTPPIQLFHVPFRVGDQWTVKSVVRTVAIVKNTTIDSSTLLTEERVTSSLEPISTSVGQFSAFKVTVTENDTLSETLWFDTSLGQVVYGEYYNDNEKVTQTLISYKLNFQGTSATSLLAAIALEPLPFQEKRGWKGFASYIYQEPVSSRYGVEDIL